MSRSYGILIDHERREGLVDLGDAQHVIVIGIVASHDMLHHHQGLFKVILSALIVLIMWLALSR